MEQKYIDILKEAEMMHLAITPQFLAILQKHLEIDDATYYAIQPTTMITAVNHSAKAIAYASVNNYIAIFVVYTKTNYYIYGQTGAASTPSFKFKAYSKLSAGSILKDRFGLDIDDTIWYPCEFYEYQAAIKAIKRNLPYRFFLEWIG